MSPAASTQSTATAVPAADCEPESPPPSGDLERTDNPTSANDTSRTTPTAAAAATTAIAPNVAQSMCTEGLLFWGSGGTIGGPGPGPGAGRAAGRGRGWSAGSGWPLAAVPGLRGDAT